MVTEADRKHSRLVGNAVCLGVHLANSFHILFSLRGDVLKDQKVSNMHRQQYIFMTIWNVIFQTAYLVVSIMCLAQEIYNVDDRGLLKPVKAMKQLFFDSVVVPYTLAVTTIFWPLFAYNRELMYPAFVDDAIGALPNYIMHAFIVPVVLWELSFMPQKVTSERRCLAVLTITNISYLIVLFLNNYKTGLWPYPMLYSLNGTVYLYVFFAFCVLLIYFCYYLQFPLRTLLSMNYDVKTKGIKEK